MDRKDPPDEEAFPCQKTCNVNGASHACSARVQWMAASLTSAEDRVGAAVKLVDDECYGQCKCNTEEFAWLKKQSKDFWEQVVPCHTAIPGEHCFEAVEWARTHGIRLYPARYDNLTSGSTSEEFQFWMFKNHVEQCLKPCDMCHTAVPGEPCYDEVRAAALANEFPANFSFEHMQAMRSRSGTNTTCGRPCERCRTAVPGDQCHKAVDYAMKKLIGIHPDWYPGLSTNSSFEDFQELLHSKNLERCAMPCRDRPRHPSWQN